MAVLDAWTGMLPIRRPEDVTDPCRPWAPLGLRAEPTVVSSWKGRAPPLGDAACRAALDQAGARFESLPDHIESEACHILNRVRISGLSTAHLDPVEMRCSIAARLYLWERHDVQPAAHRLLNAGVAEVEHFSSYSCRRMRTSRGTSWRMSQHVTANAVDISGFVLEDGRRITLKRHWGRSPEGAFLRAAHAGLCRWFNTVLGPDYNALHADHFHADMGPFASCR